jgi:hypothetical protein
VLSVEKAEDKEPSKYYEDVCNRNEDGRHRYPSEQEIQESNVLASCEDQYMCMFEPKAFAPSRAARAFQK